MNNFHLSRLIGHHEFWLGLLVIALAVGLSISTDEFLSLGNLTDVATSYAILGILACGLFVVLISGGIDISFPAMTAIAQYAMASWVIAHGGNFLLALTIAIAVGLLLGLINGFWSTGCACPLSSSPSPRLTSITVCWFTPPKAPGCTASRTGS